MSPFFLDRQLLSNMRVPLTVKEKGYARKPLNGADEELLETLTAALWPGLTHFQERMEPGFGRVASQKFFPSVFKEVNERRISPFEFFSL